MINAFEWKNIFIFGQTTGTDYASRLMEKKFDLIFCSRRKEIRLTKNVQSDYE